MRTTSDFVKCSLEVFAFEQGAQKREALIERDGITGVVEFEACIAHRKAVHHELGHSLSDIAQHPAILGEV
ncbi:hypothetical protein WT63_20175 [Burkholderia anthina]|nr:hypothetical protein WT63_20175 [Burkholderia anthina]